jgi:hypothetical protein
MGVVYKAEDTQSRARKAAVTTMATAAWNQAAVVDLKLYFNLRADAESGFYIALDLHGCSPFARRLNAPG